jgi:hypothetical protein
LLLSPKLHFPYILNFKTFLSWTNENTFNDWYSFEEWTLNHYWNWVQTDTNMTMSMSVNSTKSTDTNLSLVSTVSSSNTFTLNHETIPSLLALLKLNLPFSDNKPQTLYISFFLFLDIFHFFTQICSLLFSDQTNSLNVVLFCLVLRVL